MPNPINEIFRRIQIVPLPKCLIHEGTIPELVGQVAAQIEKDGFLKNPIIVTPHADHYVILDGMHRFAALQKLRVADIVVYIVDYFSSEVVLEPPHAKEAILKAAGEKKILPPKSTRHLVPNRPLRLDLDLAILRETVDLQTKNSRLQTHIQRGHANHHIRFYPEAVVLFND